MCEKGNDKFISFMVCGILLLSLLSSACAYTIIGNVDSYEKDGYNITFNRENGKVILSFLKDDLVRVHMAPAGKDFPKDSLHLEDNGPSSDSNNEVAVRNAMAGIWTFFRVRP
ncbi:MAG: hypothetical protein ACYS21_02795 [Planctomycetota bacterium]|jgi:hypothetical protein